MFSRDHILTSANGEEEAILCWSGKIFVCTLPSAPRQCTLPALLSRQLCYNADQTVLLPEAAIAYACIVCGAEGWQRWVACLKRVSLACLCPCSGAWDEKGSILFCAGSALGSTSALCGALFVWCGGKFCACLGGRNIPKCPSGWALMGKNSCGGLLVLGRVLVISAHPARISLPSSA